MAYPDSKLDAAGMQKRLVAVLTYDDVEVNKMHRYLADLLCISATTAKRILVNDKTIVKRCFEIAKALNISLEWLVWGDLATSDIRTRRIHMQSYKGYPKDITDKAMRFLFATTAGHRKAINLVNLMSANQISYMEALRIF